MAAPATTQPQNGSVPAEKGTITSRVLSQITKLQDNGKLALPRGYHPGNALQSAWLKLHEVQDKDKRNIMIGDKLTGVVTEASMVQALHNMVVQGLNVAKVQCYFIVYGDKLQCQRSYFGDQALVERLYPGSRIYYTSIHEGDEVKIGIQNGYRIVLTHETVFGAQDKPVVGAYCSIYAEDGSLLNSEVMTIKEIQKSWSMSKTYNPGNERGTHNVFTSDMAERTVVRKTCKPLINRADDELIMEAVRQSNEDSILAEAEDLAIENQNGPMLSLEQATSEPVQIPAQNQETVRVAQSQTTVEDDPY